MNREFYGELLRDKPELISAIIADNLRPESPAAVAGTALAHVVAQDKELMRLLAKKHSADTYWGYVEESERLALLPEETLLRLSDILGAALLGQKMALVIEREAVLELKAAFGDLYAYALKRGRYQAAAMADVVTQWDTNPADDITQTWRRVSALVLLIIRSGWPAALQNKSRSRFQALSARVDVVPDTGDVLRKRLWYFVKKVVVRELDASWTRYFN